MSERSNTSDLLSLTTEIVAAHVANNTVAVADLPQLINEVYRTLASVGSAPSAPERPQPAVAQSADFDRNGAAASRASLFNADFAPRGLDVAFGLQNTEIAPYPVNVVAPMSLRRWE